MTRRVRLVAVLASVAAGVLARAQTPAAALPLDDVVARASVDVRDYVERSSLLVAEERYAQIRRPDHNPVAGNLSRTNPGGGFSSGGGVFWMPGQMDEPSVAGSDAEELTGSATYFKFRRFTVNPDAALRKPSLA